MKKSTHSQSYLRGLPPSSEQVASRQFAQLLVAVNIFNFLFSGVHAGMLVWGMLGAGVDRSVSGCGAFEHA